MLTRCLNPNATQYADYGERGIKVCDRWRIGDGEQGPFDCFLEDMGHPPSHNHTIDRKEVNGNYEPGNCQWLTRQEQNNNRRSCHWIVYDGRRQNLTQWAKEFSLTQSALKYRLQQGWPLERALTTPLGARIHRNRENGLSSLADSS